MVYWYCSQGENHSPWEIHIEREEAVMRLKKLIGECDIKTAEAGNFSLKYYILPQPSQSDFSNEATTGMVYGVCIRKGIIVQGSITSWEEEIVHGFSYSYEETVEALNKWLKFAVTPASLLSVADDYIAEKHLRPQMLLTAFAS